MPKPPILCDIDGCIADLWGTVNKFRSWDRLPLLPEPINYEMSNYQKHDRVHVQRMFHDPRFYRRQRPLRYSKNALWTLSHFYTIHYVTARGTTESGDIRKDIAEVTRIWLAENELPEGNIYFTTMSNKAVLVRQRFTDVAFAIEDNAQAAINYADIGVLTYLVSYTYNEAIEEGPLIVRVSNLEEVVAQRAEIDALPFRDKSIGDDYGYGDFGDTSDASDTGYF